MTLIPERDEGRFVWVVAGACNVPTANSSALEFRVRVLLLRADQVLE
jgi:hypothetical protein